MKNIDIQTLYKLLFADYPDIVTVRQLQVMLGISRHAAYDLLTDGSIRGLKLGNAYKIPKINVIRYVVENGVQPSARAAGSCPSRAAKRPSPLSARCSPCAGPDRRCGRFSPATGPRPFCGPVWGRCGRARPIQSNQLKRRNAFDEIPTH